MFKNFFTTKEEKARIFAIPQLVITDKGIISIEKLKKGNRIIGEGGKINVVNKVEKNVKKNDYFYLINKDLFVYKDQSLMIDGNAIHAFEVKKGDMLDRKDGTRERITSIKKIKGDYYFHRLEVSGDHTYYINEILVHNANRFWVLTAGGTWNATATGKWSTTSGGGAGSAVPTASDDVFFDGNSGTNTITLSGSRSAKTLTCTSFAGTFDMGNNANTLNMSGSVVFVSGMTLSHTDSQLNFIATASLTSGGKTLPIVTCAGSGITLTIQSTFVSDQGITVTDGTFTANNFNITTPNFAAGRSLGKTVVVNFGTGTWTITGTAGSGGVAVFFIDGASPPTINESTSTIKFTDTSNTDITCTWNDDTFYNIWYARGTSTGKVIHTTRFLCNNYLDDGTGTHTIQWKNSNTYTFAAQTSTTGFHVAGNNGHPVTLTKDAGGTAPTLSIASGIVSCDYLTVTSCSTTGGATFYAGAHSTGGGSGWIFQLASITDINGLAIKTGINILRGASIGTAVKDINELT